MRNRIFIAERLNKTITEAFDVPEWEIPLWHAHWELCEEEKTRG